VIGPSRQPIVIPSEADPSVHEDPWLRRDSSPQTQRLGMTKVCTT